ncbi:large ribosomal subunit protein mL43-like [Lineus longissimus]|uniref:large ribosomal subunit protein mL43-like n=1 Tax=Lineus longissimus TaxID=88925 RepID=UPI002B4F7735
MSNQMIPRTILKSNLQNGVGRYVCQLQRLTIKFCKSWPCSRGTRDYIENHLVDFTKKNPGVVVYVQPRRHRAPVLVGEYLNGEKHQVHIRNYNNHEVGEWIKYLRTHSGATDGRLEKKWHTDTPSIQGVWTPFLNKDSEVNLAEFPDEELGSAAVKELSATDELLQSVKNIAILEDSKSHLGQSPIEEESK